MIGRGVVRIEWRIGSAVVADTRRSAGSRCTSSSTRSKSLLASAARRQRRVTVPSCRHSQPPRPARPSAAPDGNDSACVHARRHSRSLSRGSRRTARRLLSVAPCALQAACHTTCWMLHATHPAARRGRAPCRLLCAAHCKMLMLHLACCRRRRRRRLIRVGHAGQRAPAGGHGGTCCPRGPWVACERRR